MSGWAGGGGGGGGVGSGAGGGGAGSGAGSAGGGGGGGAGSTCVGGSATGSPGTGGSCAALPSRFPLNATATTPAVHSAAAIRLRLVRCEVPWGLTVMCECVLACCRTLTPAGRLSGYRHALARP